MAYSNRLLLWAVLFIYISVSHIFLPAFKVRRHSSLFFAKWNMFSFSPYKSIVDITWDGGQSFLLRDYRKKAISSGVSIRHIFFLFYKARKTKRTIELRKYMRKQIINFCKCQEFDVVLLKGSLTDHIIYKKHLKILQKKHYKQSNKKDNQWT